MTTDASRSNAEQWHIPPQGDRLDNDDRWTAPINDHKAALPKQPTVIATHVVDLTPVVDFFRDELKRERNNVAVERTAASSAREALAACEERARVLGQDADTLWRIERTWCIEGDYAGDPDDPESDTRHPVERRLAGMQAMHLRDVERLRAQLEQAKTVPPGLVPGSVEAVIEAYRLLSGKEPAWDGCEWIDDASDSRSTLIDDAERALLYWLDEHAPGGRP